MNSPGFNAPNHYVVNPGVFTISWPDQLFFLENFDFNSNSNNSSILLWLTYFQGERRVQVKESSGKKQMNIALSSSLCTEKWKIWRFVKTYFAKNTQNLYFLSENRLSWLDISIPVRKYHQFPVLTCYRRLVFFYWWRQQKETVHCLL